MLITPFFVYLHNAKTGGTFVTRMLQELADRNPGFPVEQPPGLKHCGRKRIPEAHSELPVVTNLRYLMDHYISRYEFRWWTRDNFFNRDAVEARYPNFPDLNFRDFMFAFSDWSLRDIKRKKALHLDACDVGVNSYAVAQLLGLGSFRFWERQDGFSDDKLQRKFSDCSFLRTHNLNRDLTDYVDSFSLDSSGPLDTAFILESGKVLPVLGGRGEDARSWESYFDDELVDLVLRKDRLLLRVQPWLLEEFPAGSDLRLQEIIREKQSAVTRMGG